MRNRLRRRSGHLVDAEVGCMGVLVELGICESQNLTDASGWATEVRAQRNLKSGQAVMACARLGPRQVLGNRAKLVSPNLQDPNDR